MKKREKKGVIEIIVATVTFFKVPSYEKSILEIINNDPTPLSNFGDYWVHILHFVLNYWEVISIILLFEGVYNIIENRSLVNDLIKQGKKLFR